MEFTSFLLFIIFVPLCFFTSFFYNKRDKFFKRFFKSFLHTFCIGVITLLICMIFHNLEYDMQDKYGHYFPAYNFFEFLSNASLFCIPIIYSLAVLIAMKFDKD